MLGCTGKGPEPLSENYGQWVSFGLSSSAPLSSLPGDLSKDKQTLFCQIKVSNELSETKKGLGRSFSSFSQMFQDVLFWNRPWRGLKWPPKKERILGNGDIGRQATFSFT